MRVLLDTNILLRTAEPGHAQHQLALDAVTALQLPGRQICVLPQNLYEFWVVSTRPTTVNGLGKTPAEAIADLATFKYMFTRLDDTPAIFPEWQRLVTQFAVLGKAAHDARLVAAMMVHSVTHRLTFNDQDFRRFPGITVLTPAAVVAPPPTP